MIQTVIRNARVFCRNQVVISDVLIERGIIAKIGSVRAGAQLTLTFIFVIWMKHIRRIGILARVQLLLGG